MPSFLAFPFNFFRLGVSFVFGMFQLDSTNVNIFDAKNILYFFFPQKILMTILRKKYVFMYVLRFLYISFLLMYSTILKEKKFFFKKN